MCGRRGVLKLQVRRSETISRSDVASRLDSDHNDRSVQFRIVLSVLTLTLSDGNADDSQVDIVPSFFAPCKIFYTSAPAEIR